MGLIRVIIILGILWVVAAILGWIIRAAFLKQIKRMQTKQRPSSAPEQEKSLVPCQTCNTFVDKAKAIEHQGVFYCSQAHLEQKNRD